MTMKPSGYKHGLGARIFTTGQIACICGVAPRTVSKWFDSGRIRGYRIPGSNDRRVPREALIKFMKDHDLPMGQLESAGWHQVLLIGADPLLTVRLQALLPEKDDYRFEVASTGFEAGVILGAFHPDTIIIDLAMGRSEGLQIAGNLRRDERYAEAQIIGLTNEDETLPLAVLTVNFNDVLQKQFDPALLAECVKRHRFPVTSKGANGIYKGGKGRKKSHG